MQAREPLHVEPDEIDVGTAIHVQRKAIVLRAVRDFYLDCVPGGVGCERGRDREKPMIAVDAQSNFCTRPRRLTAEECRAIRTSKKCTLPLRTSKRARTGIVSIVRSSQTRCSHQREGSKKLVTKSS